MFYIAICDDSPHDLDLIATYLRELKKSHWQIEDMYINSGYELTQLYKKNRRFDMIILDMCMTPLNGIETASIIRQFDKDVPIIILTSSVEYAIEGYRINALRYLVKPANKEEFLDLIKDILYRLSRRNNQYFIFTNKNGLNKIALDSIYYFESNVRTINIISKEGDFSFTGKISEIEEQLKSAGFIRTHKSYIVNLKYVSNIFREFIVLENNREILLSKHKHKEVSQQLIKYMEYSI